MADARPVEWRDAAALQGTPLGPLLLPFCDVDHPPPGAEVVKGEWPGIRMAQGKGDATSGPTGAPWIDSNGWLVRLARARKPGAAVWVAADPPKSTEIVPFSRHLVALADAAAHGGQWVVTPDPGLVRALSARLPAALDGWKKMVAAIAFFQTHSAWNAWPADAVLAVVSSFSGENEFFSHELLNLTARTNISYAILETSGFRPRALDGLRAAVYPDTQPAPAAVRQALLDFVERGGLLITGPEMGPGSRQPLMGISPALCTAAFRQGRIALALEQPGDPYEVAQDVQILLEPSLRSLRLYNGSMLGAYATVSPD